MTREEQIEQWAKDYRRYREICGVTDPIYLDEIEEAYYSGAIECNTHPGWVSVKDEKPPIKKRIIIALWKYQDETDKVREVLFVSKGHKEDWLPRVSHWLPLPPPPEHFADVSKMMPKGGER